MLKIHVFSDTSEIRKLPCELIIIAGGLSVPGRDIEEAFKQMSSNFTGCRWIYVPDASDYAIQHERTAAKRRWMAANPGLYVLDDSSCPIYKNGECFRIIGSALAEKTISSSLSFIESSINKAIFDGETPVVVTRRQLPEPYDARVKCWIHGIGTKNQNGQVVINSANLEGFNSKLLVKITL